MSPEVTEQWSVTARTPVQTAGASTFYNQDFSVHFLEKCNC